MTRRHQSSGCQVPDAFGVVTADRTGGTSTRDLLETPTERTEVGILWRSVCSVGSAPGSVEGSAAVVHVPASHGFTA